MARKRYLKIYRWRGKGAEHGNFGDEITATILERLFGIEAIPSSMRAAEFLGTGSILDSWKRAKLRRRLASSFTFDRAKDLHVWGSGSLLPGRPRWPQRLHFHAVRGELTAQEIDARPVLGDPGILASLLTEGQNRKQCAVGVVPHYVDLDFVTRSFQLPSHWKVISPEQPVDEVLSNIAGAELIISSSLHGLITADSFGIPCIWVSTLEPLNRASEFKYRDYASARLTALNEPLEYAQIFQMKIDEIAGAATKPERSIQKWQNELMSAFPFR